MALSVVRSGRISASWVNDAMSRAVLGVHRAAHVGHPGADLGALVGVEQPAVPAERLVEATP